MESQSGKNIIVGIGMVETRRCTRFDLSQIRFYMMPKHVKWNLDGDNTILIRYYMVRPPSNIESGFDIRCRSYHLDSIIDGLNNYLISNLAKIYYQIRYYMVVITI